MGDTKTDQSECMQQQKMVQDQIKAKKKKEKTMVYMSIFLFFRIFRPGCILHG